MKHYIYDIDNDFKHFVVVAPNQQEAKKVVKEISGSAMCNMTVNSREVAPQEYQRMGKFVKVLDVKHGTYTEETTAEPEQATAETAQNAEPEQEKAESEAPEQATAETENDAETKSYEINWFAERFLTSIFEMTEPLKPLWLTRKQTAVCAKNMKKSVTRDDFGEHISYHTEWNGRNVEMLYSKKNQCGSIRFSRNVEEQAEADKKAMQEIEKLEYERLQARIESIKNGNQRTINAVTQRYNQLKERIEAMNEDIAEGFYTVNEICYAKAKKELAMYSAIIAETGLKI